MVLVSAVLHLVLNQQEPVNILLNSDFKNGLEGWITNSKPVEVKDPSGFKFYRFSIPQKPANPWDVMLNQPVPVDLPIDSEVVLKVTARSSTNSKIRAMVEQKEAPYTKFVSKDLDLGSNWETFTVSGTLKQGNDIQANLHLGLGTGTIDVKNFSMLTNAPQQAARNYPFEYLKNNTFENGTDAWITEGKAIPTVTQIKVTGQSFSRATKLTFSNADGNPWDSQFGQAVEEFAQKGETVHAKVWLRSDDKVLISMVYELNKPPHDKEIFEGIVPSKKWMEYMLPVKLSSSFAKNGSQFKLFLQGKGSVEVGPISLINHGRAVVNGSLPTNLSSVAYIADPTWRKEANTRIEKLRKGDMTIRVVDANGKPVKNSAVQIRQVSHAFRFGTAAPAGLIIQKGSDGDNYRAMLRRFFNTITFENDLKWYQVNPAVFESPIAPAVKWMKENNIELRGHTLVWGSYRNLPPFMSTLDKDASWKAISEHVKDYATRMKGQLYLWDVVNEAVTETELWDKIGWDKFAEVYKIARTADPKAKLAYNDFNISTNDKHRETAIARAKLIQSYGAPLDVFGDQEHLGAPGVPPRKLWSVWDEVNAKTGLPIEVTELDFSSNNDAFQAAYIEDFYRAAFSHSKIQALIVWGFWQNAHWLGNRGGHMVNADWKWRPSMTAIDNLINKEWKTNGTYKTDAQGNIKLRGFYGNYQLVLPGKTATFQHLKAGTTYTLKR